jgi:phage/plasmid-associated DNA primase
VVTDATKQYEEESDPLADFLSEACELVEKAEVGANDLFQHYKSWAERRGLTDRERLSATMFGRKMSERMPRTKTRAGWRYSGVATLR